jgi:hypothetical protein
MAAWTDDELNKVDAADELQISSLRQDETLSTPVTIWVVRSGDDLYVRSWKGRGSGWFRGVQARHEGRISAGGVDKDVNFVEEIDTGLNDRIDDAYRSKYHRYGSQYVDPMLARQARAATIKLVPRS